MTPPLIIDNHGDVMLFREPANATAYIDALDVINKEYVGFDAKGHPLILSAKSSSSRVTIYADEFRTDEAGAKNALTRFLTYHRVPMEFCTNKSLSDLVAMALLNSHR